MGKSSLDNADIQVGSKNYLAAWLYLHHRRCLYFWPHPSEQIGLPRSSHGWKIYMSNGWVIDQMIIEFSGKVRTSASWLFLRPANYLSDKIICYYHPILPCTSMTQFITSQFSPWDLIAHWLPWKFWPQGTLITLRLQPAVIALCLKELLVGDKVDQSKIFEIFGPAVLVVKFGKYFGRGGLWLLKVTILHFENTMFTIPIIRDW